MHGELPKRLVESIVVGRLIKHVVIININKQLDTMCDEEGACAGADNTQYSFKSAMSTRPATSRPRPDEARPRP
jgi:hypothetical protein